MGEDVTALASEQECCKWHYIFTKGYVNTLRSRRAMPGDYWTASTVEDYMRCKVINYPIGVQNEAMRRDAFKTWILSSKMVDDKEKNKKGLFVVIFDPNTQDVKFVKNFSLSVNSKVETLALLEHINLGTFLVTSELLAAVAEGAGAGPHPRVFLRRIFPIQDEREKRQQEVVVEELTLGKVVTHVNDCHVLVVQQREHASGIDFDQFILSRVRQVAVLFRPKGEEGEVVELQLDSKMAVEEVVRRLSKATGRKVDEVEVFKCTATAEEPTGRAGVVAVEGRGETLEGMLEECRVGRRTVYYSTRGGRNRGEDASVSMEEEIRA